MKTRVTALAAACVLVAGTAGASTIYNFKAAAEAGGGIGESAYTTFSTNSFFAGPNLDITASVSPGGDNDPTQFVYFDAANAGIGVCRDVVSGATINTPRNVGSNICAPSSDDGLTTTGEKLTFSATNSTLRILAIWINSNHDSPYNPLLTAWNIGGTVYDSSDMVADPVSNGKGGGSGDVRIDLGFLLNKGQSFDLFGIRGPNSYISAIEVSAVPLPAPALMLLAGLGGLAAFRRKRAA